MITLKEKAQQDVKKKMKEWISQGMIRERVLVNAVSIGGWSRPTCERWYYEVKKSMENENQEQNQ